MGFSFCFGPSGSGKSRVMRKMIIDRAAGSLSTPGKHTVKALLTYSDGSTEEIVQVIEVK